MVDARIFQVNASQGGVPKRAIPIARVGPLGLDVDAVAHPKFHGGPERALCLYALERILALQEEGHPVFPGALGENVTTRGLDFAQLFPGDRLRLGVEALVEVTRYTTPCKTIAPYFRDGDSQRILHETHPGWSRVYVKVLAGGLIAPGERVVREPRDTSSSLKPA